MLGYFLGHLKKKVMEKNKFFLKFKKIVFFKVIFIKAS